MAEGRKEHRAGVQGSIRVAGESRRYVAAAVAGEWSRERQRLQSHSRPGGRRGKMMPIHRGSSTQNSVQSNAEDGSA